MWITFVLIGEIVAVRILPLVVLSQVVEIVISPEAAVVGSLDLRVMMSIVRTLVKP